MWLFELIFTGEQAIGLCLVLTSFKPSIKITYVASLFQQTTPFISPPIEFTTNLAVLSTHTSSI